MGAPLNGAAAEPLAATVASATPFTATAAWPLPKLNTFRPHHALSLSLSNFYQISTLVKTFTTISWFHTRNTDLFFFVNVDSATKLRENNEHFLNLEVQFL